MNRRVTALLALPLSAALALPLGAALTPAVGSAAPFTPGAAGVGDSYFPRAGNGGYDATDYRLRVRYSPSSNRLVGLAVMTATATQDLSRFNLDLDGLTVRSVTVNGKKAAWRRSGGELVVTPATGLADGSSFTSSISYDGVPRTLGDGSGFIHTDDGALVIGEPQVASSWFPVNDHPSDKARFTFHITAPRELQVVANGLLSDRWRRGPWTTWTWRAPEPMASYLATANIGKFRLRAQNHGDIRLVDAIDPDLFEGGDPRSPGAIATASFNRHDEVLDFLSSKFGDYPFKASGGLVDDVEGLGFALENQTRPIYAQDFFTDRETGDFVVVHEQAHQWFGDDLAVARWQHIWLNEGFASYAEWLWSEREDLGTAEQVFRWSYDEIPENDPFWKVKIGNPGASQLFDGAVYVRGAMTLHRLRVEIGDTDFFTLLKRWSQEHKRGNVTTAQFISLAEQVSGEQLDDFFTEWLFTASRPELPEAERRAAKRPASATYVLRALRSGH